MNLMELFVKIGADTTGLDSGMNDAESKASAFASKVGSGLKTAAKVGVAAVGAASAAVTAITKSAVSNYADYEQLAGGIETLFGDSAKKVMADADAAFKSAGMSANQYMETSIQSAAALINSLGGDQAKAADMMNMSITDMADNVNKMGTSMEAVQNAYRGFSRGNFSMLDNLALGFSGTKEGMQELLDKAQELSGVEFDIESYSDIVEAIHVVQTEMGITGTTAKEASGTISGSLGALKSAWDNLVTGIADPNADLGSLIDNLVDSAETAAGNLVPVIEKALTGIASLVEKLAPIIADKLPALMESILPSLLSAAVTLINALITALPGLLQLLVDQVPLIFDTLIPAMISMLPQIVEVGLQMILALANGLIESLPELIPAIVDVVLQIYEKLTEPDTLVQLIDAALQLILALAEGLIAALPKLIEKGPEIVMNLGEAIIKAAPKILAAALELISMLILGLYNSWTQIQEAGQDLVDKVKEGIMDKIEQAKTWGKDLIANFISGIKEKFTDVKSTMTNLGQTIRDYIGFSEPDKGPLSNFHTYAPDMMKLFAEGIAENEDLVANQLNKSLDFKTNVTTSAIQTAGAPSMGGTFVIPVYIGGDKVDEKIISAIDAYNYRSGGR